MRTRDKVALAVTALTLFAYGGATHRILPTGDNKENGHSNIADIVDQPPPTVTLTNSEPSTTNGAPDLPKLDDGLEGKLTFGSNMAFSQDPITTRIMWAHKPFEAVKEYFMSVFPGENFYTSNLRSSNGIKWGSNAVILTPAESAAGNGVSVFAILDKKGNVLYTHGHPGKTEGYKPIKIKGEEYLLHWGSYQEPNDKGITGPIEARKGDRPLVGYFKTVPKSMQSPGGIQSYYRDFGQEGDVVQNVNFTPRTDGTLDAFAITYNTISYNLPPYALRLDGISKPELVNALNSK